MNNQFAIPEVQGTPPQELPQVGAAEEKPASCNKLFSKTENKIAITAIALIVLAGLVALALTCTGAAFCAGGLGLAGGGMIAGGVVLTLAIIAFSTFYLAQWQMNHRPVSANQQQRTHQPVTAN